MVNGEVLAIENPKSQTTNRILPVEDGSVVTVSWQKFAPGIGPFVNIRTGVHFCRELSDETNATKWRAVSLL